jgi:hypothetical protein
MNIHSKTKLLQILIFHNVSLLILRMVMDVCILKQWAVVDLAGELAA